MDYLLLIIEYSCAWEALCDVKIWILVLALVGSGLNAAGKWQGFVFWLVTNAYWGVYNFRAGEYEQAAIFAVFEALCLFGIWKWRWGKSRRKIINNQ